MKRYLVYPVEMFHHTRNFQTRRKRQAFPKNRSSIKIKREYVKQGKTKSPRRSNFCCISAFILCFAKELPNCIGPSTALRCTLYKQISFSGSRTPQEERSKGKYLRPCRACKRSRKMTCEKPASERVLRGPVHCEGRPSLKTLASSSRQFVTAIFDVGGVKV